MARSNAYERRQRQQRFRAQHETSVRRECRGARCRDAIAAHARALSALEELKPKRSYHWRFTLVPAGTLAAVALVAFLVIQTRPPEPPPADSLGDLEILLAEEDLEMLDEDLDFYGWLEEQPEFANGGDGIG
jgi:hypothetical protein